MPPNIPLWRGEDLGGKAVLVWGEQGLGDQILFASLIPDLLRRAARVVVACDPRLATMFSHAFPDVSIVCQEGYAGHVIAEISVDTVIAAGSLGQLFRPDRESFAAQAPFLAPDPSRVEELRARYKAWSGGLPVIGVSWRSSRQDIGAAKSVPLKDWAGMLQGVRAAYVSLQYGDVADELTMAEKLGLPLFEDMEIDTTHDLAGQADQIAAMDLVVSVSNTTVHVAGGLGKSVWTLAPLGAGRMWYWFAPATPPAASLWYPSMRVFHQSDPGNWTPVLERVRNALISAYGG
jgi:ADP-heptose:LPS heptosyltransferase